MSILLFCGAAAHAWGAPAQGVVRQIPEEKLLSTGPQPQLTVFLYSPRTPGVERSSGSPIIFFSGEWGWMPMQQDAASYLAASGRCVLGIDSSQYYTGPASRDDLKADFAKFRSFLNERASRPRETEVILVGFAAGGELIPYVLNQIGAEGVRGAILIAPDRKGAKVLSVSVRLKMEGPPEEQFDVESELRRMAPLPVAFLEGSLDRNSQAKALSETPRGPHKYAVVEGADHQFHDVRDTFFSVLADAIRWIDGTAVPAAAPPKPDKPRD